MLDFFFFFWKWHLPILAPNDGKWPTINGFQWEKVKLCPSGLRELLMGILKWIISYDESIRFRSNYYLTFYSYEFFLVHISVIRIMFGVRNFLGRMGKFVPKKKKKKKKLTRSIGGIITYKKCFNLLFG